MTEKLFTGTLNKNQNKNKNYCKPMFFAAIYFLHICLYGHFCSDLFFCRAGLPNNNTYYVYMDIFAAFNVCEFSLSHENHKNKLLSKNKLVYSIL